MWQAQNPIRNGRVWTCLKFMQHTLVSESMSQSAIGLSCPRYSPLTPLERLLYYCRDPTTINSQPWCEIIMKVGRIFSYLDGETKQLGDVFQVACRPFICLQPIHQPTDQPSVHIYPLPCVVAVSSPHRFRQWTELAYLFLDGPILRHLGGHVIHSFIHNVLLGDFSPDNRLHGGGGPTKELRVPEVKEDDDLAWDNPHSWLGSTLPFLRRHLFPFPFRSRSNWLRHHNVDPWAAAGSGGGDLALIQFRAVVISVYHFFHHHPSYFI